VIGFGPPRCCSGRPIEGGNHGRHHPPSNLAHVEDIARVVVVANTGVDIWGLIPHFLLFRVDPGFLLACR
jgi:hypothetical protein